MYNNTTSEFTVPLSGFYNLTYNILTEFLMQTIAVRLWKNGVDTGETIYGSTTDTTTERSWGGFIV